MSSGCGSSPYARVAALLIGGATMLAAGAARAECGRGAACLGHWQAPRPKARLKRTPARAPQTEPTPSTTSSGWYGWQLLLVDVPVFAIWGMRYAAADISPAISWTITLTTNPAYFTVPPYLHWRRGRIGTGWLSLGIRGGLAATGLIAGVALADCPDHADGTANLSCIDRSALLGNALGVVLASAVDAAFLAWDAPVGAHASAASWAPTLSVVPGGGSLGLAAAF